jgi:prephenate dehydratase
MTQIGSTVSNSRALRVAFQGERGAFSEEAVAILWPEAQPVPLQTFDDVVNAVASGNADAGVLPVDNSIAGSVSAATDAIANTESLRIVSEATLPIRQCLLALPSATLDSIKTVESHPVALAQCMRFLSSLSNVRIQSVDDTAGAARSVSESGNPQRAAIASARAAGIYGLTILADHVEDSADNQTRFVGITRTSS